jgi:sugar transferase (PEP-CTERM/EpsH1 system associated)
MHPLRILFVAPYVPSCLRPRPLHFIKGLAERGHRVVLCVAATTADELDGVAALRALCERVDVVRVTTRRALWNCTRALVRGVPMQAAYCRSPVMTARIRDALATAPPCDVVHVEHLRAASVGLATPRRPRVYDAVDCMSALHADAVRHGPTWVSRMTARTELTATRRFERTLLQGFDRVLVSSDPERRLLLSLAGGDVAGSAPVATLPNGVDLAYFTPRAEPRDAATLVFVGRMAYHANLAAAQRLIGAIMPRIWAQRPHARLLLVGTDPPPALRAQAARAGARVSVTGAVPDIRPYLARATLSVNPLPYAAGIQNKILEAMAMATPVVASPAATAGMATSPGTHLLAEAEVDGFAAATLRLLDDPHEAARVGAAGHRYVTAHHDWQRIAVRLEAVYREAMEAGARPAPAVRG